MCNLLSSSEDSVNDANQQNSIEKNSDHTTDNQSLNETESPIKIANDGTPPKAMPRSPAKESAYKNVRM